MASNSFGNMLKITTWGESHGPAVGVVIDGCPAGLALTEEDLRPALLARAPGRRSHTSSRKEPDEAAILSGVFEGKTTGTPICIMIPNKDADSKPYETMKDVLRPGHAQYTYTQKYGAFDYRGGGRASARETVCRVAAGAVAQKLLQMNGIRVVAYLKQIGSVVAAVDVADPEVLRSSVSKSSLFCPNDKAVVAMENLLDTVQQQGDSIGGVVEFCAFAVPSGLGDPVYEKLQARLGMALMGIPGARGFEIGLGFGSVSMQGSEHNDAFINEGGEIRTATNHAGGVLGGISTGMPLVGRVAFKPTPSVAKPMETVTTSGIPTTFVMAEGSRHDPCIAIRAVPVVEAMVALVLADAYLMNRCVRV